VSINQIEAFKVIQNFAKSYYLNKLYPTDLITFQGQGSLDQIYSAGSNETSTGGVGDVKLILYPIFQKLAVKILNKDYFELVETVVDNGLQDFYMLPVYLLQFAFDQK
jgi:hypothetical protein